MKTKSVLAKVLLWNILIKFYAVKNTKAKGHLSGHLSSYLPLIYLINRVFVFFRFYQIFQVFKKMKYYQQRHMMFHVILSCFRCFSVP